MKYVKTLSATLLLSLVSACCYNPNMVVRERIGDGEMSCMQLRHEVYGLEDMRDRVMVDKNYMMSNPMAFVLFPMVAGHHHSSDVAVKDIDARVIHLLSIYQAKGCYKHYGNMKHHHHHHHHHHSEKAMDKK